MYFPVPDGDGGDLAANFKTNLVALNDIAGGYA